MEIRQAITLIEDKSKDPLTLARLPYPRDGLAPIMSLATVNYHYGKLAKGYVDKFNAGEGDMAFNEAGAFLHNLFFPQLQAPKDRNKPGSASLALIERKWGTFDNFKEEVKKVAMGIQGSGWVYMNRLGEIKVIRNHAIKKDITLLIDWWEHAYQIDYQNKKDKYLDNFWKIINWEVVNRRIYSGIK